MQNKREKSLYFIPNPLQNFQWGVIQSDIYFRLCNCVEKVLKQERKEAEGTIMLFLYN